MINIEDFEGSVGGGVGKVLHVRNGEVIDVIDKHNLVLNQGHAKMTRVMFMQETPTPFYLFPFEGTYSATINDTLATLVANAVECVAYDEASRVLYSCQPAGTGVSNNASRAVFNFNANKTIRGFILCNAASKNSTDGVAFSIITFANAKTVEPGDAFFIQYDYLIANAV